MPSRIDHQQMSRALAKGIGERLGQTLSAEGSMPAQLHRLLEEMREREEREHAAPGEVHGARAGPKALHRRRISH